MFRDSLSHVGSGRPWCTSHCIKRESLDLPQRTIQFLSFSPLVTHLLDSSQAVKLGTVKLLLEHKLMKILGCIGLSLECLQGLEKEENPIVKNSVPLKCD